MWQRFCILAILVTPLFFGFAQGPITGNQLREQMVSDDQDLFEVALGLGKSYRWYSDRALQLVGLSSSEEPYLGFNFGSCIVASVYLEGTAKAIGLSEEDFLDTFKLRLSNDLGSLPDCRQLPSNPIPQPIYVTFTVWTVGKDYPVAYYLETNTLSVSAPYTYKEPYHDEVLGFGPAENIERTAKDSMAEQIEGLSVAYLKGVGKW